MLLCLSLSVILLLFFNFAIFDGILFLELVESQPVLFPVLFLFLGKSQPGVSYKGCS